MEYRGLAVREVIVPTVGSVTTLELLKALNDILEELIKEIFNTTLV